GCCGHWTPRLPRAVARVGSLIARWRLPRAAAHSQPPGGLRAFLRRRPNPDHFPTVTKRLPSRSRLPCPPTNRRTEGLEVKSLLVMMGAVALTACAALPKEDKNVRSHLSDVTAY